MAELAERVVLSPSGVTHLVTRLERDGLVQRIVDEDDRRSFFAALTPTGQPTAPRLAADAQRSDS